VNVAFGPAWKEPTAELRQIVQKWPNGNLKAIGQTQGYCQVGRWTYYNERGDRTGEVDFDKVTVLRYDPNLPANKGLGKAKAKE